MSFFKTHLPPTLHNAAGTIIAAAILTVLGGLVVFIKAVRDFPVPLWAVVILFAVCVIPAILLSKKKNQKYTETVADVQKEQANRQQAIIDAHSETQAKNQNTIERLTGENTEMKRSKEAFDQQQTQIATTYAHEIATLTQSHAKEIENMNEAHAKALSINQQMIAQLRQDNKSLKSQIPPKPEQPGLAPGSARSRFPGEH